CGRRLRGYLAYRDRYRGPEIHRAHAVAVRAARDDRRDQFQDVAAFVAKMFGHVARSPCCFIASTMSPIVYAVLPVPPVATLSACNAVVVPAVVPLVVPVVAGCET